jgi:hypothetical protein
MRAGEKRLSRMDSADDRIDEDGSALGAGMETEVVPGPAEIAHDGMCVDWRLTC